MFLNRRKSVRIEDGNLNTLVDQSVSLGTVDGRLCFRFEKSLRFDGQLDGDLVGTRNRDCVVVVGPKAVINGNISAQSVVVLGTVAGNIAADYIEVREAARVSGDIAYVRMEIHQGSQVEGRMLRVDSTAASPGGITPP